MADGKKHKSRDVCAIIGAGIVLATFLWNEFQRDRAKEIADKVAAAQTQFVLCIDAYNTQHQVLENKWDLLRFEILQPVQSVEDFKIELAKSCVNIGEDEVQTLRSLDKANDELLRSTKSYAAADQTTTEQTSIADRDPLAEAHSALSHVDDGLLKLDSDIKTKQKDGTPLQPSEIDSIVDPLLQHGCTAAHMETVAETSKVRSQVNLHSASKVQEDYEEQYNRDRNISYGLYGFGWLVALIGKWAGGDDDTADLTGG